VRARDGIPREFASGRRAATRLRPVARRYPTIIDLVGNTPIVRLDRISRDVPGSILAKLEFLNPGGSLKDRIGLAMIEAAEREGKLMPGGTIVEPTSGNTGVGLAMAAALKDYRCIFVMPDKMSQEKISMLRAYGAEVVITPTAVEHDSPESYYSVSSRLAEEIPGGFKPDQYSNMANPEAHYRVTGPEIWEQTGGEVDALVISVGTGGTISGVGRYFKERKPEVLIVGADPEGSVYTADNADDLHPYLVEGIGKDTWPKTMDAEVVDEWVRVSDGNSFLVARRLAREEGILAGGSAGTTVWAAMQVARRLGPEARVLTLIPDSGRSYMSKFYDDNWMLEHGFVERKTPLRTVEALLKSKRVEEADIPALITISAHQKVGEAIDMMQRYSISQLPVVRDHQVESLADVIGSLQDRDLLDRVFKNPDALHEDVANAMQPPLGAVETHDSIEEVFARLTGRTNAVVVARSGKPVGVITRSDLLEYLAHNRGP
jgi:cystathionine beta-synthase